MAAHGVSMKPILVHGKWRSRAVMSFCNEAVDGIVLLQDTVDGSDDEA